MVPWGRDSNIEKTSGEGVDWVHEKSNDLFLKGQSRRIWAELYKVLDCSDVVLHIIDARNVPGTKCEMIGQHLAHNAKHKVRLMKDGEKHTRSQGHSLARTFARRTNLATPLPTNAPQ